MKKILLCAATGMMTLGTMAQETYESAQLMTEDLNGTARYVGMGGAMEALGADISTISSNPAGIGLMRRSWIGFSAGATIQKGDEVNILGVSYDKSGVTNADLNQIGFVYANQTGRNSSLNFAFNYHKNSNFNQIMTAVNSLNDASLNKMSYMRVASLKPGKGWPLVDTRWEGAALTDALNYEVLNDALSGFDEDDGFYYDGYSASNAYAMQTENSGYISNFDFCFSGNINNRTFLGITFGLKDVRYRSYSMYDETLVDVNDVYRGDYLYDSERKITGSGFDIKIGAIFRPIAESPFRVGLYINTPTWYTLRCSGVMGAKAVLNDLPQHKKTAYDFSYDYKISTPWKFGASLGTTFGSNFAIGATYEYADYGATKNLICEGNVIDYGYDYWGYYENYYTASSSDRQMDRNTEQVLKGTHLVKVGMEFKPVSDVAIRLGYNFRSAMYNKNGHKDFEIDANPSYGSVGSHYSTYDYTNWDATHRVTFGLGFKLAEKLNLDLSYQYATQKGTYHPFQDINDLDIYATDLLGNNGIDETTSIYGNPSTVKNNRHQINATLSYRF